MALENLGPCLGREQKCGCDKLFNGIPIPLLIVESPIIEQIKASNKNMDSAIEESVDARKKVEVYYVG